MSDISEGDLVILKTDAEVPQPRKMVVGKIQKADVASLKVDCALCIWGDAAEIKQVSIPLAALQKAR